jgi:hypothetical protein
MREKYKEGGRGGGQIEEGGEERVLGAVYNNEAIVLSVRLTLRSYRVE